MQTLKDPPKTIHHNRQSSNRHTTRQSTSQGAEKEKFFLMTISDVKEHYKAKLINAQAYVLYIVKANKAPNWKWTFNVKAFCTEWEIPERTFYWAISKLRSQGLLHWSIKERMTLWYETNIAQNPDTDLALQDVAEPVQDVAEPVQDVAEPVQDVAEEKAESLDITSIQNATNINQIDTNSSSDIALAVATPISHPNEELNNSQEIKQEASQVEVIVPSNASCQPMSQTNSLVDAAQLNGEVQQITTQPSGTECSAAPPRTDESPADLREKWLRQKALTLPKPIPAANLERWVRSQLLPENWQKWEEDYTTDRPAPQYELYPEGFEEKVQQWRSSGVSVGICYNASRLEIKTNRYTMSAAEFMEMPIEPLLEKPDPNFHAKAHQLVLKLGSRKKEKN
jgi:hypothetical protein